MNALKRVLWASESPQSPSLLTTAAPGDTPHSFLTPNTYPCISVFCAKETKQDKKRPKSLSLVLSSLFPTAIGSCCCQTLLPVFPGQHSPTRSSQHPEAFSENGHQHLNALTRMGISRPVPKHNSRSINQPNFCGKLAPVTLYRRD